MFALSFQTAILAIAQIFVMGLVGFLLVRRRLIDEAGLKLLSFLSVNIIFPLFIFNQILLNFHPSHIRFWWGYPLVNVSLIITGLTLTMFVFIWRRQKPADEVLAVTSFHNAGYIPLLLVMALPLGSMAGQVYAAVIIAIIGFDTCLWTLGVWLVTRKQNPRMDLRKMINPPLLSMAAAILLVLCGQSDLISQAVLKPVKIMGDGAMALAMLTIGGNLALTQFGSVKHLPITGVVLIKLVLMPSLTLFALLFLRLEPIMGLVLMIQSCMPTSITLSIIGRHYDTPTQDFINQSIFFTHLCALATVPIFLTLYSMLVH